MTLECMNLSRQMHERLTQRAKHINANSYGLLVSIKDCLKVDGLTCLRDIPCGFVRFVLRDTTSGGETADHQSVHNTSEE